MGITTAKGHNFQADLEGFLAKNYHGEMAWLEERKDWRSNPEALWPEAQSIIMLAEAYLPPKASKRPHTGNISAYALGRDYHDVVKKRLKALGRDLIAKYGGEIKVFVDTAPVMEKPLAQQAGIGWQGKHGNLLSRELGNWFFLGAIFTTLKISPDLPAQDHCGSCTACVDACPTQAFDQNGKLDPRKCISYLTIESKEVIPPQFRNAIGNLIYGCDICLSACPWNKFSIDDVSEKLLPHEERTDPELSKLLSMNEAEWAKFMSNCLIAAGNSGDPQLRPFIEAFLDHEDSRLDESARWAIAQHL